ncbi:hypothetical protein TNCV_4223591 [Trichonephila clavipes]|nr:hypothetical protein TNCV_4223591 [Trichonephila clavipes]
MLLVVERKGRLIQKADLRQLSSFSSFHLRTYCLELFFMNSVASTLNRVTDMEFNNQISVLTQNNWNTWKHDMQVLLMHYGCWQFIIQTKPEQPDEEATYKEKIRSTTSQKVNINLGYNLNLPDYYDDEDDSDRVKDSLKSRLVSKTSTETPSTSEKPDVSSDNHSLIPCQRLSGFEI